jgi:uncharacterized protein
VSLDLDVRDLVGQPGASRSVHLTEPVEGLSTEVARVPEDRLVAADLELESVVEGILVSGEVIAQAELSCARCLTSVHGVLRVDVEELFAPEAGPTDDEYPLMEGRVDLEQMIRDALVPAMPFAPLCRPECLGLCERCGGDRNRGECSCPPEVDPRWAPLVGLELAGDDDRP